MKSVSSRCVFRRPSRIGYLRRSWFVAVALLTLLSFPGVAAAKKAPRPAVDLNAVETVEAATGTVAPAKQLRVVAFNIHYGRNSKQIESYLRGQLAFPGAVVFLLSEADRHHSRSGDRHPARELAEALGLNMAWGVEFVEYSDKTPDKQGAGGNAILSNVPLKNVKLIRHTPAYDWKKYGALSDEPRDGGRMALAAVVEIDGTVVRVVSAHLENRADGKGRKTQMNEILSQLGDLPAVIGGDMNEDAGPMDADISAAGFHNAFDGDKTKTGGCVLKNAAPMCILKLDWIYYRGLRMTEASVDPPGSAAELMSDHAPVRAEFEPARK